MSPRASSRDAILIAAGVVVREQGAAHLTLDAVSAKAKISKGGLLYHFPTKEALLLGMIVRLRDLVGSVRKEEASKLPDSPGKGLKAHIQAMAVLRHPKILSVIPALIAAGTENPKLLEPIREFQEELINELSMHGIPKEFTAVVLLALDGMWLLDVLGASKFSPKRQQSITGELLRLVKEEEARLRAQGSRRRAVI